MFVSSESFRINQIKRRAYPRKNQKAVAAFIITYSHKGLSGTNTLAYCPGTVFTTLRFLRKLAN
jgi:hypothetical protein